MLVLVTSDHPPATLRPAPWDAGRTGPIRRDTLELVSCVKISQSLLSETWLSQDLKFPFQVEFCTFVSSARKQNKMGKMKWRFHSMSVAIIVKVGTAILIYRLCDLPSHLRALHSCHAK